MMTLGLITYVNGTVNKVMSEQKKNPGGVTGFFSDIFPSDRTMVLGSTQPLVKTSIRNIPGGKGGRCVRLTTSPHSRAECHEIWEPKPPGTLWTTRGLLRDSFTFYIFRTTDMFYLFLGNYT
jgi:hypothetical protein